MKLEKRDFSENESVKLEDSRSSSLAVDSLTGAYITLAHILTRIQKID